MNHNQGNHGGIMGVGGVGSGLGGRVECSGTIVMGGRQLGEVPLICC